MTGISGRQIRDGSVELADLSPALRGRLGEQTTWLQVGQRDPVPPGFQWLHDNFFVVPEDGTYLCIGRVRVQDGVEALKSYGLAVTSKLEDGHWMLWQETMQHRNGAEVIRLEHFRAGERLGLMFYTDSPGWPVSGSLAITRLS